MFYYYCFLSPLSFCIHSFCWEISATCSPHPPRPHPPSASSLLGQLLIIPQGSESLTSAGPGRSISLLLWAPLVSGQSSGSGLTRAWMSLRTSCQQEWGGIWVWIFRPLPNAGLRVGTFKSLSWKSPPLILSILLFNTDLKQGSHYIRDPSAKW